MLATRTTNGSGKRWRPEYGKPPTRRCGASRMKEPAKAANCCGPNSPHGLPASRDESVAARPDAPPGQPNHLHTAPNPHNCPVTPDPRHAPPTTTNTKPTA